jgi:hypothetical protein
MDSQTAYMHATFNQNKNVHIGFYPKKEKKKRNVHIGSTIEFLSWWVVKRKFCCKSLIRLVVLSDLARDKPP